MEVFPTGDEYAPSVGASQTKTFRVLRSSFGNGYEQVAVDGINSQRQEWSIAWQNIDIDTTLSDIKTFLDARGANEAFYWTPPGGTQIAVRMVDGYTETYDVTLNVASLSTTFKEVYDGT